MFVSYKNSKKNSDKAPFFIKPRTPPQIHPTNENQVEILNMDDDFKEKMLKGSKRITLNARGTKFDVFINLFDKEPKSRLAKLKAVLEQTNNNHLHQSIMELCDDYDQKSNEFYFNREPFVLNMIINYLSFDKMHCGDGGCPYLIADELKYWGIDEYSFDSCCNDRFWSAKNTIEDKIIKENTIIENYMHKENFGERLFPDIRAKIWEILEHPEKSWIAAVFFLLK